MSSKFIPFWVALGIVLLYPAFRSIFGCKLRALKTRLAEHCPKSMKTRVRAIFWLHVLVAAYCIVWGLLDADSRVRGWLIPDAPVFFLLLASVLVFPLVAIALVRNAGCKHPMLLVFTHVTLSVAQFYIGLAQPLGS